MGPRHQEFKAESEGFARKPKKPLESGRKTGEKKGMPKRSAGKTNGFTLVEMIIVLVVLSILVTIAIPEVMRGMRTTKAATCGAAIRQIQTAKERWRAEFPGVTPTTAQLARYFPAGGYPKDPWGIGFQNETDLTKTTSHVYNNDPRFEPEDNCGPENGYNDAFQPKM